MTNTCQIFWKSDFLRSKQTVVGFLAVFCWFSLVLGRSQAVPELDTIEAHRAGRLLHEPLLYTNQFSPPLTVGWIIIYIVSYSLPSNESYHFIIFFSIFFLFSSFYLLLLSLGMEEK
jgi:hypothetical protein